MRRLVASVLAATALGAAILPARGDPTETEYEVAMKDEDYAAGQKAIAAKQWQEAITRLHKAEVRYPEVADLHNYLGFAYRNLKQFEPAFKHYKRAIELDPRHRGAHEYIGEAYLMVGDVKSAEKHLAELRKICLLPCDELKDLEKAFAARPR